MIFEQIFIIFLLIVNVGLCIYCFHLDAKVEQLEKYISLME